MPRAYTGRFMQHPASQLADECGGIVLAIAPHSRTARRGALATGFKTADMLEAYHGFFVHASLQASLRARVQKSRIPLECSRLPLRRDRDSNPRYGFEPEIRFCRIHAFQACLLSHSSISPEWECKYTLKPREMQMNLFDLQFRCTTVFPAKQDMHRISVILQF